MKRRAPAIVQNRMNNDGSPLQAIVHGVRKDTLMGTPGGAKENRAAKWMGGDPICCGLQIYKQTLRKFGID